MGKLYIWFDKNISGNSSDSRWGIMGIFIAFILFAPTLVIYFFDKGGVLMFSPTVCTTIGYVVLILWAVAFILAILVGVVWWKHRLQDTTPERLRKIEKRLIAIEKASQELTEKLRK
jgi:hypothetical protein